MPKIERIEIKSYEYVFAPDQAYGMARSMNTRRVCSLIVVTTDQGVVGYGESSGPLRPVREYLAIVAPFFLGRSVFDFEIVAAQVYNRLYHFGVQGHLTSCLSGISVALHDAIGKALGLPVHDLIGGRANAKLACYATTGEFTANDSDGALEAQLERVKARGFRMVKIKIGKNPDSDRDRARIARQVLGDDAILMVDVNGNYTPDIAYESIRRIERYDVHFYEEPLPPTDVRGYAELRAKSPIRIAAGEACYTVHDFKRLTDVNGVDILQPAVLTCGGLGQVKQIAQLAAMNNLRIAPNGFGGAVNWAATLHYVASLPIAPFTTNVPYPNMIEYHVGANPFFDSMLKTPFDIQNGEIAVPTGPGLGVEIDFAAVEPYATAA
jgi:D-galactarolactone cycloisomerase